MTDTTAPTLNSLSIPTAVDLSNGSKTVTFVAGATDDLSGIYDVVVNFDKPFPGGGTSFYIFGSTASWMNGTGSQSFTIPVNTPAGVYTITSVNVFDNAGNESIYGTTALQNKGIATTLTVSGSDTTGPQLTGLSFDSTINLSSGDATFHYAASATDRSGVADAIIRFDNGLGSYYIFGSSADTWADGSSSSTSTIAVSTPPGTYHVTEVDLQDSAGNSSAYTATQLQALGLPTTVTVTGSDTTGPTLTGLSFDRTIDLSAGAATFHFGASATDRSGVSSAILRFDGSLGSYYIFGSTADPWTDGSSASTASVPVNTPAGVYHLTEVDVQDGAGNTSTYTASQLQALGYATTVTVSASDVSGPTLTGFTHPTNVSLAGGAAQVTIGVSATDRSGIASAYVTFDKALFAGGSTAYLFGTTADPWTDGASTDTETVPTSTAAGVYTVTSLQVRDGAGNTTTYTTSQLAALGYATTITVGGNDTTPPQLTGLTFPASVDVSTAAKTITFGASGTDNATGIADVTLTFDKNFSGGAGPGQIDIGGSAADPWTDGASTATTTLSTATLPGVYTITSAVVTDGAGNKRTYTTAQLQALGLATALTVKGDATRPQLTGLTFPSTIDVSNGQRVAPFAATATDNATGIRDVTVTFDRNFTGGSGAGIVDLNGGADSWSDGSSTLNLIVPTTAVSGTYNVTSVTVTDGAGNVATYSAAQLAALGIATSLNVVGGQSSGSPQVTFANQATFTGNGAAPTFSGTVTDSVTLSSVKVYNGTTLLGTATVNTASHSWSLTTTLAAGTYSSLNVVVTDTAGATATGYASYSVQTGITGQSYVTIESDYTTSAHTTLLDQRFLRTDGSLYLLAVVNADGTEVDTYYNVTGQAYTSYEYDFDVNKHVTIEKFFGYTGQPYVTLQVDVTWNNGTYTANDQKFFRADGSLYELDLFNADGSGSNTFYAVTGQAYTTYEVDFDTTGHITAKKYSGYTATAYTSDEIDFDVNGHMTAHKYLGYTGQAYVTIQYDYTFTSISILVDEKFYRANNALYELEVFNADSSYTTTFYGITGQAYTSYEYDYDTSNHYTAQKFFGYTGRAYVTVQYDYTYSSSYTLIDEKFLRADNTLYELETFGTGGSYATTFYGITGQAFSSYEIDYDKTGHMTARKNFGYTSQPYVTIQYDYTVTTSSVLVDEQFIKADGSLYLVEAFGSGGTQAWTYYGITGQAYTSYEIDYDASKHITARKYFGYSGQAYTSVEYDYNTSNVLTAEKFFKAGAILYLTEAFASDGSQAYTYYGITGQPYTSYEIDYDKSKHIVARKYFGYTNQSYTSLEYDYNTSNVLIQEKFFRGNTVLYLSEVFNVDKSQVNTYYGITGQAYTSYEIDYDASKHMTAQKYFGYTGQPYVTIEKDYGASNTLVEQKYIRADATLYEDDIISASGTAKHFYGVTGQAYASYEDDYDTAGRLTREAFYMADGTPKEIKTHNADGTLTDDVYHITGQTYSSYEAIFEANGVERSQTINYTDGSHEIDGEENNITLTSTNLDEKFFGGGSAGGSGDGSGITFLFKAGFGHDIVYDFYQHLQASDASHPADTIQLPKTEFASFAAFTQASKPVTGSNAMIATATNGDSLTLYGMTMTSLQSAQADFRFV